MSELTRTEQLREIRDQVWNLTQSPLFEYRKKNHYYPVLGEGCHTATIMFIGEAPGENEAKQGRPFCGAAGKLLDEMISSIGLERKNVYITNIVKDRPPGNRDPLPEEISLYGPFLDQQIAIIQPKVIATLGRFSMSYILNKLNVPEKTGTITKLHGLVLEGEAPFRPVHIVPLFHPAVALYDAKKKETLFHDFQVLKQFTE